MSVSFGRAGRFAATALALLTGVGVAGSVLTAMLCTRSVNAGNVAVYQYKPFFFGQSGIDKTGVMGPTRVYLWPLSTSMWEISLAPDTVQAHANDFMSADRVPLDFDLAITYKVTDPSEVHNFIRKFGAYPASVFRSLVLQDASGRGASSTGELMSFLRDQVRRHHSSEFIAAQKADGTPSDATSAVEKNLREHVNTFLAKAGAGMISVENVALGRANPPKEVADAIGATAQAAQDIKTQAERQKAEVARKEAEIARALADRAYQDGLGISGDAWLELQKLRTYEKVCGNGNCTFVLGNESSVMVSPRR